MMHVIRRAARGAAAVVAATALAACDNEVPTATGSDLFPGGVSPTTLVTEFTGAELLLREEVHVGFGNPRRTPFLLVANNFDGVFDAHPIARFEGIPDSVSYTSSTGATRAEISAYAGGRVLVHVDTLVSFPTAPTAFLLWELTQPWDSTTVTWEHAIDRPGEQVPWTTPGGARGELLATKQWAPGDTVTQDTVVWELDSLTVARLRNEDHPGLLVTIDRSEARFSLSDLIFEGDARPAGDPDTLIQVRVTEGPQTFLFSPATPDDPDVLSTGGLLGNRTILTLDLGQEVEACPAGGGACSIVPLSEVTLNRAQLVLEPIQVAGGHRPLATPRIQLRRIAEPELGRFAPLGTVVSADTIAPAAFTSGDDREVTLDLTSALLSFFADRERRVREAEEEGVPVDLGPPEMSFALITDFATADLGLLWFQRSPILRVVYTLPLNPTLP